MKKYSLTIILLLLIITLVACQRNNYRTVRINNQEIKVEIVDTPKLQ